MLRKLMARYNTKMLGVLHQKMPPWWGLLTCTVDFDGNVWQLQSTALHHKRILNPNRFDLALENGADS